MTPPETSGGSVTCPLCNAIVSVRSGNFYKFQLHLENDHDVFRHQDLLMALSFLDTEEMEVIIEKVLPRMKAALDVAAKMSAEKSLNSPFLIHKRLSDFDIEGDTSSSEGYASSHAGTKKDDTIEKLIKEEENKLNVIRASIEEDILADTNVGFGSTYAKSGLENALVPANHKVREEKKKKEKSLTSAKSSSKVLLCKICNEMIKKYKYSLHKRNCEIMQNLRAKEKERKEAAITKDPEPEPSNIAMKIKSDVKSIMWKPDSFDCKLCDKKYRKQKDLMKHAQMRHIPLSR